MIRRELALATKYIKNYRLSSNVCLENLFFNKTKYLTCITKIMNMTQDNKTIFDRRTTCKPPIVVCRFRTPSKIIRSMRISYYRVSLCFFSAMPSSHFSICSFVFLFRLHSSFKFASPSAFCTEGGLVAPECPGPGYLSIRWYPKFFLSLLLVTTQSSQ